MAIKFGGLMLYVAIVFAAILFKAFVLIKLWTWFIVPMGVVPISYASAIGLSLVARLLTPHVANSSVKLGDQMVLAFSGPAFALAFGAIVNAVL